MSLPSQGCRSRNMSQMSPRSAACSIMTKPLPWLLYCNGPFCGKSKRLSAELIEAGYANVRRYQLGIPVWRALGGVTQIELEALLLVLEGDHTAVSSMPGIASSISLKRCREPEIYRDPA